MALGNSLMATTFPETEECTGADTNPPGSPIISPFFTSCPIVTTGLQGAPACWLRGITTIFGDFASVIGLFAANVFLSGGCIPPLNVAKPIFEDSSLGVWET